MKLYLPASILILTLLTACSTTVESETLEPQPSVPVKTSDNRLISERGEVRFVGKNALVSHEGIFRKVITVVKFEGDEPVHIASEIKIDSMVTDSMKLTAHLLNEDFFDSEKYPLALLIADDIKKITDTRYKITGDLTIKDVTEEITFEAEVTENKVFFVYDLNRIIFGVGKPGKIDEIVPLEVTVWF